MAIRLLSTLFDFEVSTIVRDLSFDIEKRLVARGAASYDLSGGTEATVPTLNPNLSDVERHVLMLEELLLTNRNTSGLEPFSPSDWALKGIYDYNDLATATTPISVPATETFVDITNDGAGPFTNLTNGLPGITGLWNTTNQEFDFSSLAVGDSVNIRLDIEVTTTSPNQLIEVVLAMAQGSGGEYELPWITAFPKSSGVYKGLRFNGLYIGDDSTKNFPAKFKIKSDASATVKVNGWYIQVNPRFPKFEQ